MKQILRYTIPVDGQRHEYNLTHVPAQVAAGTTVDEVNFWVLDDDDRKRFDIPLLVVGTGDPIPPEAMWVSSTDPTTYSGSHHLLVFPPKDMAQEIVRKIIGL